MADPKASAGDPKASAGDSGSQGSADPGSSGPATSGGRWRTAVPMLLVVALITTGLILISLAHWRRGTGSIAAALLLVAGMRLTIAPEKLGPLVIRSRAFDVLFSLLLAGMLVGLGLGWFSTETSS